MTQSYRVAGAATGLFVALAALILVCVVAGAALAGSSGDESERYTYLYHGQVMRPTVHPGLVAVRRCAAAQSDTALSADSVRRLGLERHALSSRAEAQRAGLTVYRRTATPGLLAATAADVQASLGSETQPVFDAGGALMIPSDTVLIGLHQNMAPDDALYLLQRLAPGAGLVELTRHANPRTYVARIEDAGDGRAFAVARELAALPEVRYAEPDFVVLVQDDQQAPADRRLDDLVADPAAMHAGLESLRDRVARHIHEQGLIPAEPLGIPAQASGFAASDVLAPQDAAATSWTIIESQNFEVYADLVNRWHATQSDYYHLSPWKWGWSWKRAHGGSYSAWCAESDVNDWGQHNQSSYTDATMDTSFFIYLDFSGYEEVYVGCWFWADNDLGQEGFASLPVLYVWDTNNTSVYGQVVMASGAWGDMYNDPHTDNGWCRLLYRVPPRLLSSQAVVQFVWMSQGSTGTQGCYVDDVLIVGSTNVDTGTISNDTYSGRQFDHRNVGQLAGLVGQTGNWDMNTPEAWGLLDSWGISVPGSNLVLAVIDDGVDLTHPDLNVVSGFGGGHGDGSPVDTVDPGSGQTLESNHGTACAGAAAARRNNGIGVAGTAAGARIMAVNHGGNLDTMASSIAQAVAQGADVLSNSWGWASQAGSQAIEDAIVAALNAGVPVVFAAGNGPDRPPYTYQTAFPGCLADFCDMITVGATGPLDDHKNSSSSDGSFAWGSSYLTNPYRGGGGPTVCAPGPWTYTTDRQGASGYNKGDNMKLPGNEANYTPDFGGTSSATPKVAGIVALMRLANPGLTPRQIKQILMNTAKDISTAGFDERTGAGRVDAYQAVLTAHNTRAAALHPLAPILTPLLQ